MDSQYTSLSRFYDLLTENVNYTKWADYLERLVKKHSKASDIVLELGCGTGTLSQILSSRGYDMICVDNSPDMLGIAKEKCEGGDKPPLFLCQDMCELDLFGTVDVALCCLDSLNYLTYLSDVKAAFSGVSLFLNAGGAFIFDVKTPDMMSQMNGLTNAVSLEDGFYFWQYDYNKKSGICQHNIEIFTKSQNGYDRMIETHFQRGYDVQKLEDLLYSCGFSKVIKYRDLSTQKSDGQSGRVFIVAIK